MRLMERLCTSSWVFCRRSLSAGRRGYWRPGCAPVWTAPARCRLVLGTSDAGRRSGYLEKKIAFRSFSLHSNKKHWDRERAAWCVFTAESLTCGDLLGVDVGFDVRGKVRGFRVLAWGQVGRYGRPRCHRRRGIPSHRRAGIPGHHSTPTWLRDDEWQRVFRTSEYLIKHPKVYVLIDLRKVSLVYMYELPRSLQPVWRHCILQLLQMAGRPDRWTALTGEQRQETISWWSNDY